MNSQEKFAEAFYNLTSVLGYFGSDAERKRTIEGIVSSLHRTTQQTLMRNVIIPVLEVLAENYRLGRCDQRNMSAGRLATLMLKDLTDDDLYLPLI